MSKLEIFLGRQWGWSVTVLYTCFTPVIGESAMKWSNNGTSGAPRLRLILCQLRLLVAPGMHCLSHVKPCAERYFLPSWRARDPSAPFIHAPRG